MSIKNSNPESRNHDLVVQELEDEVLVYDLLKNKVFCLNKTSAVIWQTCNGERTIDEIAEVCGKTLKGDITPEMVWVALEQFKKDNLLEKNTDNLSLFNGMSRREVIKKASIGSLIALPIVSSLVAPNASYAQSGCFGDNNSSQSVNGCSCNSASDCQSRCCGRDNMSDICVTQRLDPNGSDCRAACECAGNCCAGGTCFTAGAFATGTACVSSCQCAKMCVSNVCN